MINPKLGSFNVTAKGGIVKRSFFDVKIAQPFLVLLFFNFMGLLIAIPRFFIWDKDRPGTVIMNTIWCFLNIIILGVCSAVSREMQQLRGHVRIKIMTPVRIKLADGRIVAGETIDLSSGGTAVRLLEPAEVTAGETARLLFPMPSFEADLPVTIVLGEPLVVRLKFAELNIQEQEYLTMILYSRADTWLGWGESREIDQPMKSLGRIFLISFAGLKMTFVSLFLNQRQDKLSKKVGAGKPKAKSQVESKSKSSLPAPAAHILLLLLGTLGLLVATGKTVQAQPGTMGNDARMAIAKGPAPPPGQFRDVFSLADTGAASMEMHGIDSQNSIFFTLQQTHVVKTAKIHIYYAFSPSLLPQLSHMQLSLNGTLFATIPIPPGETPATGSKDEEAEFSIPPELLVRKNILTIEFIGHYVMVCEDPANTTLWARVQSGTYMDFAGEVLPLTDDLKQLPLPFLDTEVVTSPKIPVVFATAPTSKAIQAAGIVSSYFGMESENRPVRFPTYVGQLPAGNSIVISESPTTLPAGLNIGNISGPTLAMRANPTDAYSKVLIITGQDADQVLIAAQAVALHSALIQGATSSIDSLKLPDSPGADVAPRWARTDDTIALWDYANADSLQGDGSAPINVYFRIPPDIFYSDRQPNAKLRMTYRYNPIPIGPISSIQVRINNAFLGSLPLIPGQEASKVVNTNVPVPVVNLRPFSNSLSFDFTFQLMKKGGCTDTTPINHAGCDSPRHLPRPPRLPPLHPAP